MNAGAVKAGGVFVEIGADPRRFFATLNRVNKAMGNMGRSLAGAGAKVGGIGVATLAPFAAAVRAGAGYQSTLLNIQASTGATATELDKLKTASMQMSAAMGKGPTEIAGSFLELLKAGMSVEQVLGGAGKAAIEFAAVGQMDVAQAAVVMADAMNVFGVDASTAANSISSAADASSTSIELMSQSFAQVSAVAALANQSIGDTSAALAILANSGVKGSDAGTSLKTMLMRLMAPADDAVGALTQIGLSVASFRGADGKMKPLVDIIGTLNGALGGMDQAAKDDIFRRIFGSDAIRAAAILTSSGVDGFNKMTEAMGGALSVGEKYKTLMSGLAGAGSQVMAAMERFGIAVSDAVAPALMAAVKPITGFINGLADLATNNKEAVALFAKFGVAAVAIGGALTGVGLSLQAASFGFGGILKTLGVLFAPLSAVGSLVTFVGMSFYKAIAGVLAYSTASVASAVASGAAWAVANAPLLILIGLLGAAGAAAIYAMGGFSGIAEAIGNGMNRAAADGMVVLGDLATTATTTFSGIYEAIAAGDLSGAMDVLWAGLYAGWLRGVEALMGAVDPWISTFQNTFTYLGTEVAVAWENLWTSLAKILAINGAIIQGALDNLFNGIAVTFDNIEATASKALNLAQKAANPFMNLQEANSKVDAEMKDRADKREKERPGLKGRLAQAEQDNIERQAKSDERVQAMRDAADQTAHGREEKNARRRDERRAATQAAEANLESVSGAATAKSQDATTASELLKSLESASSLDQITNIGTSIDALLQRGNISGGVEQKLMDAYYAAFSRVNVASASASGMESQQQVESGAAAAGIGGPSQSQVVGTFSSVGLGGLGFGGSLVQKIAEYGKRTAEATEQMANEGAEVQA